MGAMGVKMTDWKLGCWGEIDEKSDWHTRITLNGRVLKKGDTIELKSTTLGNVTGVVEIETRHHQGMGGMSESWSWDIASLRVGDISITLKTGMLARFPGEDDE